MIAFYPLIKNLHLVTVWITVTLFLLRTSMTPCLG